MATDDQPPSEFGVDDDESKENDTMFVSAISPGTVDISLSGDEEDDNPFGDEPPTTRKKTPTNTTNTVESSASDENNLFQANSASVKVDDNDDDLFGTNKSTAPATVSPPSSPKPQDNQSYSADLNASSGSSSQPTTFDSQVSSSTPVSTNEAAASASKPVKKRSDDDEIEIAVSDPTKVGEVNSQISFLI